MNRQITKTLYFIVIAISLVLFITCSKKDKVNKKLLDDSNIPQREKVEAKNEEQTSIEKVILITLDKYDISPTTIKKLQKDDGIYFYIPIEERIDLDNIDMVLQGSIEQIGGQVARSITDSQKKVIREYYDKIHRQNYIIEIYYQDVNPGFKAGERKIDTAYLCVIVDDFGNYNTKLLDEFAASRPEITFAVIPGLPHSKLAMEKALNSGHEVIVHIPMQAINPQANPGSNAVFSHMTAAQAKAKVQSYFKELPYAVGANQHMGSKISSNQELMEAVLSVLQEKELFFVDSKTIGNSIAYKTAVDMNIPAAERNLFLDAPANSDEVLEERINDLRKLRNLTGKALVITHCHDKARLDRLNRFILAAEEMGFELVPASKYVSLEPEIN
ncbi:MAG: divergent polysaccharide deacetylase family protein [Candidatus Cloacimonadales bacterium]|jgi:polysaccharide deacetylase 2 family uncharacterized protein YibQ|nr:divergent polysaccharide deacetylase family protein [Candidatus Cloacimonadota bacterium]MDD2650151.1 divergent polysaccharide deacetylase family protein [Candidatus Cloacimonadota bacterium]MDD3500949.1 divergent polysaccharide deacetylase family protein [Candidatus Cloacimonadota bacterium]MDX9977194.1 divergent polysaccharide deacetylase family protein [Candidatus Cloacimonadales bacterium]